jgi:hypothetical protein
VPWLDTFKRTKTIVNARGGVAFGTVKTLKRLRGSIARVSEFRPLHRLWVLEARPFTTREARSQSFGTSISARPEDFHLAMVVDRI